MKEGLIIIAHGSRLDEAKQDFTSLVEILKSAGKYSAVQEAFLERNTPDLPGAIDILVSKGIERIIITPCLLFRGIHTEKDIPQIVEQAGANYPQVDLRLAAPIGPDPLLAEIILKRAEDAGSAGSPGVACH